MGLLNRVIKAVSAEISKPESFSKGETFEDYVRQYMFPKEKYDLIHKTHNYNSNKGDFVETTLYPDFKLRCKETGKEFFVEAKFREGVYYQNKIEWCKPYQLKRYQEINKKECPVFIAFGIGDNPKRPSEVFVIPVSKADYTAFFDSFLNKYSFHLEKPVFNSYLWKL